MSGRVTVLQGDAAHLPLPDGSVDAVVCDPPYALTDLPATKVTEALTAWVGGDRGYVPKIGGGFMGRSWDRFVPPPAAWDECLRVLKPGGWLLAFAAPRTQDLMGMSIRLAGFEIRESIDWIFGQGYPKSLDVSKAIDRAAGAQREVTGQRTDGRYAYEFSEAASRAGGIMGQPSVQESRGVITAPATEDAARWEGWGTALKPAHEPVIVARKPLSEGTVAANVLTHGTGALNLAACQVGAEARVNNAGGVSSLQRVSRVEQGYRPAVTTSRNEASEVAGRWPPNVVLSEAAAAELDRQSGASVSRIGRPRASAKPGDGYGMTHTGAEYADEGGASRFFPVFRYEAKAPTAERPRLPDGTSWPTVKPLNLIRWMARLVTRPGGTILDPFAGTGTLGEAAIIEGFNAILVDKDPQAIALTRVRLAKPIQPDMFGADPGEQVAPVVAPKAAPADQGSLFDLGGAS